MGWVGKPFSCRVGGPAGMIDVGLNVEYVKYDRLLDRIVVNICIDLLTHVLLEHADPENVSVRLPWLAHYSHDISSVRCWRLRWLAHQTHNPLLMTTYSRLVVCTITIVSADRRLRLQYYSSS